MPRTNPAVSVRPVLAAMTLLGLAPAPGSPPSIASAASRGPQAVTVQAGPGVSYRISPPSGPAPLAVVFDARVTDAQAQRVRWSFPDGSAQEGARVTRTFYRPGTYAVDVEVTLAGGRRLGGTTQVVAQDNGPERARATILAETGRTLWFDARPSVVYGPGTVYRWDFGDGDAATGERVLHRFEPGRRTVRLYAEGAAGRLEAAFDVRAADLSLPAPLDARVLELTNLARTRGWDCSRKAYAAGPALPPLRRSAELDRAARAQSAGMTLAGYFGHESPVDGSGPAERATSGGYAWRAVGENIAAGQGSAEEVVDAWLRSPGHCKNILSPDFTEIGLSAVRGGEDDRLRWTQVFGTPRD